MGKAWQQSAVSYSWLFAERTASIRGLELEGTSEIHVEME